MLPEKFFDTGELVLTYVEASEFGSPLLLLHGLTGWWHSWEPIFPYFTESRHVYACDLRGHGKSGRITGQYRVVDYGRDIAAFVSTRITEPVVLIGHSLGALTSIAVAAEVPQQVRAVVLVDPPLFLRNRPLAASVSSLNWFSWVYETLKSSPSYDEVFARCRTMSPESDEASLKSTADNIYSLDIGTVATVLNDQLLEGWDLERALRTIPCPTLLMRGDWDHDAALDDEDAAYVKANLRAVIDFKIPNASHMFMWEHTDLTIRQIQSFLASV